MGHYNIMVNERKWWENVTSIGLSRISYPEGEETVSIIHTLRTAQWTKKYLGKSFVLFCSVAFPGSTRSALGAGLCVCKSASEHGIRQLAGL